MSPPLLFLASASPHRRSLLARLGLPFQVRPPGLTEQAFPGEAPAARTRRLAIAKARAVQVGTGLVIGSDQVAAIGKTSLGKPGTLERGVQQLLFVSGREVCFFTALCLRNVTSGSLQVDCVPTWVRFRTLTEDAARAYLAAEAALDCAGSFRSEGLGIILTEHIRGSDPSALVGLPLIRLGRMLRAEGVELPPGAPSS